MSSTSSGSSDLPKVGGNWRGKYEISEQLSAAESVIVWRGRSVDGAHSVILRACQPTEPDERAAVWAKLGGIDSPHLQHARDAQRAGQWRIEIAEVPRGIPLQEWRAAHGAVDTDTVKAIVAQLADALAALHAFELVHLNLRPDAIYLEEKGAELHATIGGLERVTSFDRSEPLPMAVDPFYAPPEALGLNVHVPGPGLCAWDWWSLGRVTQELILGRHITAQIAKSESAAPTPELRAQAEALLLEADPQGPRAGAVELMPAIDSQLTLVLRGLLTGAREARWTGDNVDRWVRGLPAKEHYAARRSDTHFRWKGRPCTIPEIATILQGADHWAENSVQLFEPTTPGTLAHFLRWSPNQTTALEQLTSALELSEALPLKLSNPTARREAVVAVALLQLSAGKLVWRGHPFEKSIVAAMMSELGEADAMTVLRALTTRSTALQIERIDAMAGRVLTELGRTIGDVEGILRRYGWLAADDVPANARLFRLALEPLPDLRATRERLAQGFAGSDHPAVDKLFKSSNFNRTELVVLAWMSSAPEKYKFYSHLEAARRRAEALRTRGVELINALVWAQLERALGKGPVVFGGWGWFTLAGALAAAVVIVLWPGLTGIACALVPTAIAFMVRVIMARSQQRILEPFSPNVRWTWRDGPIRCRRELGLAGAGVSAPKLETELQEVTKELAGLTQVQPPPAPLPVLPTFHGLRLAGTLSWAALAGFAVVAGWRIYAHPPTAKGIELAWAPAAPEKKPAPKQAAANSADQKDADVKVSWPYKPLDSTVKALVVSSQAATSAQAESVLKHGRELVAPYLPETIDTLVIMPVAAGSDGHSAVMLFDGKRGELVNDQVYTLEFEPIPRSWVEVGGHRGIYLDR